MTSGLHHGLSAPFISFFFVSVAKCVVGVVSDDGLTLGPRSYAELKVYLQETFGDQMKKCEACKELVGRGESCSNGECNAKMHESCVRRIKGTSARAKCLRCRADWIPAPRRGHLTTSSTRHRQQRNEDEEDEADQNQGHGEASSSAPS